MAYPHLELDRRLPKMEWLSVSRAGKEFHIPVQLRMGTHGPTLLFVHGLGGAKENFLAAFQSQALSSCTLVAFDLPGTGLAQFDPEAWSGVSALAELAQIVRERWAPRNAYLVAASMGGLIALLLLRKYGTGGLLGMVNIEGNLAPEDCMFSRRTASCQFEEFSGRLFEQIQSELLQSPHTGDHIIAHNMALNTDKRAYHRYSFETVAESDSGQLLKEFLALPLPKLFLYGEANRSLSYLSTLCASDVEVREIPKSAHFLFYDNPVSTFEEIGKFVSSGGTT